jgi:hypothetical protein
LPLGCTARSKQKHPLTPVTPFGIVEPLGRLATDLWLVVILHYQEVVRTRQPLFAPISVTNGRWCTEVSRLLLPLPANSHVNFIMAADYKRDYL